MISAISGFIEAVNYGVWSWPSYPMPWMVLSLLGVGLYLTFRMGFINIRAFWHSIQIVSGKYDDPSETGDISHFQALTTALSATVGVGNIAGVAMAIHYGGPGALFWMWVTAFLGMSTKFAECTLATTFRVTNDDGSVSGGPMYYIELGMGKAWRPMAFFFAACTSISAFGSGNASQAHTLADAMYSAFRMPTWMSGALSATLLALVVIGGIKRIGQITSRVIPAMTAIYVLSSLAILFMRAGAIPSAFATIVSSAFSPHAAISGFVGSTFLYMLTWGVKRGLFSNEAGQGSAPIAHAAARTDIPVREGIVALLEPFIDTLTICTLTGLVIVTTGVWKDQVQDSYPLTEQSAISFMRANCDVQVDGIVTEDCVAKPGRYPISNGRIEALSAIKNDAIVTGAMLQVDGQPIQSGFLDISSAGVAHVSTGLARTGEVDGHVTLAGKYTLNGEPLTARAFHIGLAPLFPGGEYIITFCIFLFALSTAIGWSYYGERGVQYLFGDRAIIPYRFVFVAVHFIGSVISLETVWAFSDISMGLMAVPNLIALIWLSNRIARDTKTYMTTRHVG